MMQIKALAPWAGSKRNLAPKIVAELGPHRAWWELCCGSCAVTLVKPPASMETVVDLNGDLVNLALCIQSDVLCGLLEDRLHRTWMSDDLFQHSAERIHKGRFDFEMTAPDWERAYDFFVFSWMGRNGQSGTTKQSRSFCRRFTANGGHAATRFRGVVDSLTAFNDRMRGLTILRADLFEILPRIEDARGTVIYIDPPYIAKGLRYIHDDDGSQSAVRKVLNLDDKSPLPVSAWHRALSVLLNRLQYTRVIVSYYAHPLLAELYPGWTVREFDVSKSLANSGARGKSDARATEVLLINGPSLVEPATKTSAINRLF